MAPSSLGFATRGCHKWLKESSFFSYLNSIGLKSIRRLSDGSYLAYIWPSEYGRRKNGERLMVRVIEYTIDDPNRTGHGERHRLVTSLRNARNYPAHTLAVAYHERWEVEITIDETDTHQRRPLRPFRSRTPLGVLQEFYGLLLAHYAVREDCPPSIGLYDYELQAFGNGQTSQRVSVNVVGPGPR